MNLRSYLLLDELLKKHPATHKENRAFGLEHPLEQNRPIGQLFRWMEKHISVLRQPYIGDLFSSYVYTVTLILSILVFIIGFFSGMGLLSYSGQEPVNIIYFLAMVVFVPLLTIPLAFLFMLKAHKAQNLLVHISPAFWMEKIVERLSYAKRADMKKIKIDPLVGNWLVIERSQLLAWVFSWGLVAALLGAVITKDIAFAWSTTLKVSPEEFYDFVNMIAFAWRDFVPEAVPSLELIEQSRYFRLGEKVDARMIRHASMLGEWWKFLLCSALFYAIILRFGMFLLAKIGLRRALKKSILSQKSAVRLLYEMNEPLIASTADGAEDSLVKTTQGHLQEIKKLNTLYDGVLGWSYSKEEIAVLSDAIGIAASFMLSVGGNNSLANDAYAVSRSYGEMLLCIKAWEPPTMDFIDFVQALSQQADKIIVVPLGTPQEAYQPRSNAVQVWARKLALLQDDKVWLKI